MNTATNVASLAYFAAHGDVRYAVAVPMAVCNLAGGVVGARVALKRGAGFVRALFLVIVAALLARIAYDMLRAR